MRLWSIHPKYLDSKGLVAVWREGLLALHVLRGQTKGYTQHPQLIRFKNHSQPVAAITNYLHAVVDEAEQRNFKFDRGKLESSSVIEQIPVTEGQLKYEIEHLKNKLLIRDLIRYTRCESLVVFDAHPIFKLIPGDIEPWEKVTDVK